MTQTDLAALAEKLAPCRCSKMRREFSGHGERCPAPARPAILATLQQVEREALERAAQVCRDQAKVFLSPEYATHQPLSSVGERVACAACEREILAMIPEPKEPK